MATNVITVKLHKVRRLQAFAESQAADVTPAVSKALEQFANDIAAMAKVMVHVRSGRLKRSIRVKEIEPKRWQVQAGNRRAFYGHFVEGGTIRSRAYPFLRPAFEAYRAEIAGRIMKAIKLGLFAASRRRNAKGQFVKGE